MSASLNEKMPSYPYQALPAPSMATDNCGKHRCSMIDWNSRLKRCPTDSRSKTWWSFAQRQETPSGAFMPYRQVLVDSLLRSMTDTMDIGYVARETSPYWPESGILHASVVQRERARGSFKSLACSAVLLSFILSFLSTARQ